MLSCMDRMANDVIDTEYCNIVRFIALLNIVSCFPWV